MLNILFDPHQIAANNEPFNDNMKNG